jgi:Na+/H+ antiporter NhaD/arsenite permease-like protein
VDETGRFWLTLACFTLTYAGLALGRLPGLRTDRAGIALAGAALVLATGLLTFDAAVKEAIDFETIALLLGMMLVVAHLRLGGFFDRLAGWALARVRRPRGLLAVTMALSGGLSAFLVNDVVCVALTPLVLDLARKMRLDPRPHLLGLALASNIGSTATLTGNPQNMIIGSKSHIPYLRFTVALAPVALAGLALAFLVVCWVHRAALRRGQGVDPRGGAAPGEGNGEMPRRAPGKPHRLLLLKSVAVTLGAVAGFLANLPMPVVALTAATLLLLGRVNPRKVYEQVDWGLLVMFCGLFVVVRALNVHVVKPWGIEHWGPLHDDPVGLLSLVSAGLSNVVSNVPAVLLFEPVIETMSRAVQETAWLALAMSSTLAGNLTVLGSVANLIVVEGAHREGVHISFWDYARVGVPATVLTLAVGVGWLYLGLW